MSEVKQSVYQFLENCKIEYRKYQHQPVFTVDQAKELSSDLEGTNCRNLFLRNRKGNRYYLVILEENEELSLQDLRSFLNETNLSFASAERLFACLKVKPGAVGAFGLINDDENKVAVVLGKGLRNHGQIQFHPNENDETLSISYVDFEKILNVLQKRIVRL